MSDFKGYRRASGHIGIRNHCIVLPLVVCANSVSEEMGRRFQEIIAISHPYGCTFDPYNNEEIANVYVGLGSNPNIGGILLVSLGCETIKAEEVYERIKKTGQRVDLVSIQGECGTGGAIAKADAAIRKILAAMEKDTKETAPLSELLIGTECGASDSYSGISANPVVGNACDRFIDAGATVFLTEVTEFLGAEDILGEQAATPDIAQQLQAYCRETEMHMARVGVSEILDIAPGNIAGGLSTLEEKSLGCIRKGGTRIINEVVPHATRPSSHGLIVMDAPGHDVESMVAMAAGGANLIYFTTGRGTPTGCPGVPVVKVSSNTPLYHRMKDNIDFNAGEVIDGKMNIEDMGAALFQQTLEHINGERTASEKWRCHEFAIRRKGVDAYIL